MKRGCVKTTHPLFCFIKNVFAEFNLQMQQNSD